MAGGGWPVVFAREAFGVRIGGGVLWGYLRCSRDILKNFIYVMEMWN